MANPRPNPPLTEEIVAALTPGRAIADGAVIGLQVRWIHARRKPAYVYRYRRPGAVSQTCIAIGLCCQVPLEEARARARATAQRLAVICCPTAASKPTEGHHDVPQHQAH